MKFSTSEPGMILSAAVHAAMLAVTLIAFSDNKPFEDAQESVPVEVLTDQQFNQISKGEKDAKPAPTPKVRVDKEAEVEDKKPPTPKEAKVDVQAPPPPLKHLPDPGEDETPLPPEPPKRVATLPPEPVTPPAPPVPTPPLPTPRPPEPPKAEAPPEPPKPQAEPIEPPRRPPEPKKAETPPPPPLPPKPPVRPHPTPQEAKPKPERQLDKVALAKLLEKTEDAKPARRPKSGEETSTTRSRFDPNAIAQVLSREPPGQRPSTGHEASRTASLGAPTANAQRLSPSLEGQIGSFVIEQYRKCWSIPPGYGDRYQPQIRVSFNPDGTVRGRPELMNRQSDSRSVALAESAVRAILNPSCNPMRLPPSLAPYFERWVSSGAKVMRFDSEDAF